MVIQPIVEGQKSIFDLSKVHHPTPFAIDFTRHMDFHRKRMSMEPRAFVSFRNGSELVRRFKGKALKYIHNCDFITFSPSIEWNSPGRFGVRFFVWPLYAIISEASDFI